MLMDNIRVTPKKGDNVEILRLDILCNKPRPLFGRITRIDGFYIYVKPKYQRYECELYQNEIRIL
jgi:hypothetical protein